MRDLLMDLGIKDAHVLLSEADANRDGVVQIHEFLAAWPLSWGLWSSKAWMCRGPQPELKPLGLE